MSSTARDYQALMRDRLIESRLTPNAISLTGFALCVVAAVLVWQDEYFLGGLAFIVGSVCDTLDGRYSRMSGKGTPFGAFLDSTLDRIEEGVVLTAVAFQFSDAGDDLAVAAGLVWQEELLLGGIAFVVGSVCDTLDGRYSRMSGKGSPFGAFLDSTLDRIEEGVVLAAVAVTFSEDGDDFAVGAVVIAVVASLMVSYTRARAEALGVECKVGIADRAVRVVILSAGLILAGLDLLEPAVYVLAGLSVITVMQRVWHVRRALTA